MGVGNSAKAPAALGIAGVVIMELEPAIPALAVPVGAALLPAVPVEPAAPAEGPAAALASSPGFVLSPEAPHPLSDTKIRTG